MITLIMLSILTTFNFTGCGTKIKAGKYKPTLYPKPKSVKIKVYRKCKVGNKIYNDCIVDKDFRKTVHYISELKFILKAYENDVKRANNVNK